VPTTPTPTPAPTGSRCRVSATSVYCEHQVTSFQASATEIRDVYWQTPTTAAPAAGYPVVLVYQGSLFAPSLTWAELAPSVPFGGFYQGVLQASLLDHGFTVIAPTAAGGLAWQTNTGAPYETTTDHVFIGALIEAIKKGEFGPADSTHFYATGISSGGYMTSRMAVSYPGVFRALAIESGSYATCLGPLCNVPATLPPDHPATLFLHGAADATVPLSTAEPYHDKLVAQGVDTELVVDQTAGHQWLSVAPERVTDWFSTH
jgi:pimeloyl-ACP methyl ester carboxylesterase